MFGCVFVGEALLLSIRIMFLRLSHVVPDSLICVSLLQSTIPLYGYTNIALSIPAERFLDSFFISSFMSFFFNF